MDPPSFSFFMGGSITPEKEKEKELHQDPALFHSLFLNSAIIYWGPRQDKRKLMWTPSYDSRN